MTIRQKLANNLVQHGLWEKEAETVLTKLAEGHPEMEGRWNESTEMYQAASLAALWVAAKATAIDYLKETTPTHFALRTLTS